MTLFMTLKFIHILKNEKYFERQRSLENCQDLSKICSPFLIKLNDAGPNNLVLVQQVHSSKYHWFVGVLCSTIIRALVYKRLGQVRRIFRYQ